MSIKIYKNPIREYDMRSANISVLAEEGYIDKLTYLDIEESPKAVRNKLIGLLIRDYEKSELYDIITSSIDKYVTMFLAANSIKKKDVLERSHDALFVQGTEDLKETVFGDYVEFRLKHKYSLLIEFPVNSKSNTYIKMYKTNSGIDVRYAKIDKKHECYGDLVNLIYFIYKGKKSTYYKELKKFVKKLTKSEEPLILGVDNEYLSEVFREIPFV